MPETTRIEAELRALEARLDEARVRGDLDLFEKVLADEFRTVNPIGMVTLREQALADTRSGAMRVRASRSTDIVIRAYGSVAVVSGRAALEASFQGHDISGVYPYTHVYVLRDGRWQVVAAHTSAELPSWAYFIAARLGRLFRRS